MIRFFTHKYPICFLYIFNFIVNSSFAHGQQNKQLISSDAKGEKTFNYNLGFPRNFSFIKISN
jgi:hypothetical protein